MVNSYSSIQSSLSRNDIKSLSSDDLNKDMDIKRSETLKTVSDKMIEAATEQFAHDIKESVAKYGGVDIKA